MMDPTQMWKYDVFLSFRGKDTRKTFTDHLYDALVRSKIRTFRDDGELQRGREISSELLKAIEESRISIIIFSENYATSRWCLEELVKILDCKKTRGQLVLPLFFNVDPSDVRKQEGSFREAFDKHERFDGDRFEDHQQSWRRALTEAGNLSGWDLRTDVDGFELKLIKKVVREVQFCIANDNMVTLEEEEAKLKAEEHALQEKMMDLKKQMEAINLQAEVLSSRRAHLVARRSSLEEMTRHFGSEDSRLLQPV
ncbi:hypothetical protein LguiB_027508 [Lonicera macranthoides]